MNLCVVCEAEHEPNQIVLVNSGVCEGVVWEQYKCLITNEEWLHLEPDKKKG